MANINKNTADRDRARLRELDIVEMRCKQGLSFNAIAETLGVNRKTVYRRFQAAMQKRARETVGDRDALIGHQVSVIETVLEGMLPRVANGDPRAADMVLRALERQARLFGLDAPIRASVTVTDEMTERIKALAEELAQA